MTRVEQRPGDQGRPGDQESSGDQVRPARPESEPDDASQAAVDAAELIAQIRQLTGPDPAGVRQVVTDVLAALDRVTGGSLREQLPDEVTARTPTATPDRTPTATPEGDSRPVDRPAANGSATDN